MFCILNFATVSNSASEAIGDLVSPDTHLEQASKSAVVRLMVAEIAALRLFEKDKKRTCSNYGCREAKALAIRAAGRKFALILQFRMFRWIITRDPIAQD